MKLESLRDLYVDLLRDVYDAERQITKALPKLVKAANSRELKDGFKTHLTQTQEHVQRLDQIFDEMGTRSSGKKCKAMEGLLKEGEELIDGGNAPDVLDAGLIGAAQKVEHYEIASYGTARAYAELLGEDEAADLLQQTLTEEGDTDKQLTQIAQRLNARAKVPAGAGGRDGADEDEDEQ